jgi:hypothetical protein
MSASNHPHAETPNPAAETETEVEAAPRFDVMELLALIGRDVRRVQEELAAVGSAVPWPSGADAVKAAEDLRQSVGALIEQAQTTSSAVAKQAATQSRRLREQMEKHPVAAVSSAFALGYFLGRTVFGHKAPAPKQGERHDLAGL